MAALTAMTMIAMAFAPVGSAGTFANEDCSAPTSASTVCKTVFGPAGATDKVLGGVGAGFCFGPGTGLPFPCNVAGGGAAFFDVDGVDDDGDGVPDSDFDWNDGRTSTSAHIWVEWIGGGVNLPDPSLEGFEITGCADRNDDICTNAEDPLTGAVIDDFATAYSAGGDGKDSKGTGNGDAQLTMCFHPDVDGVYDDIVVFISAYSDASGLNETLEPVNPQQVHVSSGNFEVWLQDQGTGC